MQQAFRQRAITHIIATLAAASLATIGCATFAAELPEGTVISKDNLDKIKNDTFMGHSIGSLLTEKVEWQIRNWNVKLPLKKGREPELDPAYVAATKKYSGQVQFNPQTREVTGWVAGMPFPSISESDPYAGEKVLWNFYYGQPNGSSERNENVMVLVGKNGFESSQILLFQRFKTKGRLDGSPTVGDPQILSKTYIKMLAPEDVKGTGTYTIRYDAPAKLEDSWAYIKSARRIRRLSGNSWTDQIGGLDIINDDVYIYNARPSQYKQNKLIGKRWILAVTDHHNVEIPGKKETAEQFEHFALKEPLFGITKGVGFTPREVWVVEGTPPPEHPYSKKIVYVDTKVPVIYQGEMYDKKGDFWRFFNYHFAMVTGQTSSMQRFTYMGQETFDFKARHATLAVTQSAVPDPAGVKLSDFSPEGLESLQ